MVRVDDLVITGHSFAEITDAKEKMNKGCFWQMLIKLSLYTILETFKVEIRAQ